MITNVLLDGDFSIVLDTVKGVSGVWVEDSNNSVFVPSQVIEKCYKEVSSSDVDIPVEGLKSMCDDILLVYGLDCSLLNEWEEKFINSLSMKDFNHLTFKQKSKLVALHDKFKSDLDKFKSDLVRLRISEDAVECSNSSLEFEDDIPF